MALFVIALSQLGIQYSFKWITDTVIDVQKNSITSIQIVLPILFFFLMICISGNTGNLEEMMITAYSHKAKRIFAKYFLHKSYITKQDRFYDSQFYDQYTFIKNNIENTSNITVTVFNRLTMALYRMMLTIMAISYFNPLIIIYMVAFSLLIIGVNQYAVNKRVALQERYSKAERQAKYYQDLLSSRAHAKELRIFRLQERFLKKWEDTYNGYMNAKYTFEVKVTCLNHLTGILQVFVNYGLTIYFLYLVARGEIQVGDFIFLNGLMRTLLNAISSVINVFTKDLAENDKYVEKYESFTGKTTLKQLRHIDQYRLENDEQIVGKFNILELKNVSYRYPGANKYAVQSLNFTLRQGEVVSLLGYNGSGKSTLSKLMSGLLEDYEGQILINGIDIKRIPKEQLYRHFGIGFQDFSKYSISLEENVAVGMIEKFNDKGQVKKAIEKGNLQAVIERLPNGLETILGKEYSSEGQDLSGGQWQRIILSRAYMGEPDVLILDEPTAAIDPLEEMRMLGQFKNIVEGRTALLISHRIGFARMADRICMMEEGELVEEGSHEELIKLKGNYYKLFIAQQELYKKEECYA